MIAPCRAPIPAATASSPGTPRAATLPVMENISKAFVPLRPILENISLRLVPGGVTCLLGPSGCGKSTLLRIAAGLIPPDAGTILLNPAASAVVFQEPRLLPWLDVAENLALALPRGCSRSSRPRRDERIAHALAQVQLSGIQNHMPRELSGGMAQRVGIARALLKEPSFLLMDEPFAALDAITRVDLQSMLKTLIRQNNVTCLFVTHDINEALALADQILLLKDRSIRLSAGHCPGEDSPGLRTAIMRHLHTTFNPEDTR